MALGNPVAGLGDRRVTPDIPPEFAPAFERVAKRFPKLRAVNPVILRGDGEGFAEVFPPDETMSPRPGRNVIELRNLPNPKLMEPTIATEAIQLFSRMDPTLQRLKRLFAESLTDTQRQMATRQFAERQERGDRRPFQQFLNDVFLDAEIRAAMFPELVTDEGFDPETAFTPRQREIVSEVIRALGGRP